MDGPKLSLTTESGESENCSYGVIILTIFAFSSTTEVACWNSLLSLMFTSTGASGFWFEYDLSIVKTFFSLLIFVSSKHLDGYAKNSFWDSSLNSSGFFLVMWKTGLAYSFFIFLSTSSLAFRSRFFCFLSLWAELSIFSLHNYIFPLLIPELCWEFLSGD